MVNNALYSNSSKNWVAPHKYKHDILKTKLCTDVSSNFVMNYHFKSCSRLSISLFLLLLYKDRIPKESQRIV